MLCPPSVVSPKQEEYWADRSYGMQNGKTKDLIWSAWQSHPRWQVPTIFIRAVGGEDTIRRRGGVHPRAVDWGREQCSSSSSFPPSNDKAQMALLPIGHRKDLFAGFR